MINLKSLDTQHVKPTLDELDVYFHGKTKEINADNREEKMEQLAKMVKDAGREEQTFAKGDVVKVCSVKTT
jgi:hypothetical protein